MLNFRFANIFGNMQLLIYTLYLYIDTVDLTIYK
ncbi:unknown [Bacteroides finegoldii CAG:203]|jgi:hypothetical protein|uniref:Uncharacterized protein n=1 Tax=Bacteroides finegoldii TaxID=338188 RepID=A0A174J219_9BACE|nr:unknown [Bacteroides finegoldii CAG:203]CUO93764.1 Uncharacterised protein [Bacteroides finegoldii]